MKLYAHQEAERDWFLSRHSRAGMILSDAGLGKSVTAIAIGQAINAARHLIIAPSGMGRILKAWSARMQEWAPDRCWAVIDAGPRSGDSELARCRKAIKLAAPWLIVTPDLLKHAPQTGWDMISIDEIHEYTSARAQSAQQIRALVQANLEAVRLGLTATPMTAEPLNTWVALDMLWPGQFGRARPTGDPPWTWQKKWGNLVQNEHGISYKGLRDDVADDFRAFLAQFSIRTLREDLGGVLPKIDIRPYVVSDGRDDIEHAVSILDTISRESLHVAAYSWNVEPARELHRRLCALPRYRNHQLCLITGQGTAGPSLSSGVFDYAKPSILIGTIGALGRGISLSHISQYVVWQPIKTAHYLLQLDGRHVRLDNPGAPPAIGHVLLRDGRDDAVRERLLERLDAFAASMRTGNNVAGLRAAIAKDSLSSEELGRLLGRTFRHLDVEDDEESNDDSIW